MGSEYFPKPLYTIYNKPQMEYKEYITARNLYATSVLLHFKQTNNKLINTFSLNWICISLMSSFKYHDKQVCSLSSAMISAVKHS